MKWDELPPQQESSCVHYTTIGSVTFSNESTAKLIQLIFNPGPGEDHGPCNLEGTFCASENYAFNYYTHDKVHPNTMIQSLMANSLITVLNQELALGIAPFSDQEIIDIATTPVPEPRAAWGLAAAVLGLGAWARRRRDPAILESGS